jgi:tetratricopeptide (TPR) repeat protein
MMLTHTVVSRIFGCAVLAASCTAATAASAQSTVSPAKVPVTTSSDDARRLYLQARDLAEKLRITDARRLYTDAVAKDQAFALGYLGLAYTAGTTREFIDATTRAASLSGNVSEGERRLILAVEAGMKGDPAGVLTHYNELVRLFPKDERALTLLGTVYFGRQEYDTAINYFKRATVVNPSFSAPYNQLGYAYRFVENYTDAENTFKKYVELIPDDPNPYDSYAELLMKVGRFDESIAMYRKALAIDPNFVASYVGIGSNHLSDGRPADARAAFARIAAVARNTGEQRLAHFWTAAAYVHEGATDKALGELKAEYALAEAEKDAASMSGDLTQMGDVLREAGRFDEALARYGESVTVVANAPVPDPVKAATRRNLLFEQARVAAMRGDVATAKSKAAEYAEATASANRPLEVLQRHELAGMIALAEKQYTEAVKELALANQQDPRILYLAAVALRDGGDKPGAAAMAGRAAKFNGLSLNYGYVRARARTIGS